MEELQNEVYNGLMNKPLEEIKQDIFFRADHFKNEPWYNDFQTYRNLGICQPKPEYALEVQKALKVMGYSTHAAERNGKLYLLPGKERADGAKALREEWKMAQLEEREKAASFLSQKVLRQKDRER